MTSHNNNYFITATDTDAGKTYVACALSLALIKSGKRVAVYKPIAAGCDIINSTLVNQDARQLADIANCGQTLRQVNPIAFAEPIAPHIAANKLQRPITLTEIIDGFKQVDKYQADITISEGAGGWRLPLGNGQYLSSFVKTANLQVVLVVNMKLGCLNHAILTHEAIMADGLSCVAWVANCPDTMPYLAENIAELDKLLPMPRIAQLACEPDFTLAVDAFDLSAFDE
jgi:dethiobiotin synthetase